MMWWNHSAWGAGDWQSMSLMMLTFWALLIALVLGLVRGSRTGSGGVPRWTISPIQQGRRGAGGAIRGR